MNFCQKSIQLLFQKVLNDSQDEFLELKIDSAIRDMCDEKLITEFRPLMCDSYQKVGKITIRTWFPFVILCASSFSTLLQIKTKQQSKFEVENDPHFGH